MNAEKWLPVRDLHGKYEVSSYGRLRKIARWTDGLHIYEHRLLPLDLDNWGYYTVSLTMDGEQKHRPVHRHILEAFVGPAVSPRTVPNHINGVKTDNRVENLEWATPRENNLHSYRVLGQRVMHGSLSGRAKLTEADAIAIRKARLEGATLLELARRHRISQGTVSMICLHKIWKRTVAEGERKLAPHTIHRPTGGDRLGTNHRPS